MWQYWIPENDLYYFARARSIRLLVSLSLSLSAKAVPIGDLPNMTGNKFSKDFDMMKDTF
jgi:hypothetical protein